MENPFKLTKEEEEMMKDGWKKKKTRRKSPSQRTVEGDI